MNRGSFFGSRIFDCSGAPGPWSEFRAERFPQEACGVCFRPGGACNGVPPGGIGTGAVDWNPDGRLGRTTMGNSFPPPREQDALELAENIMHHPVIRRGRVCHPPGEIGPVSGTPARGTGFHRMMVPRFLPLALDDIPLGPGTDMEGGTR